MDLLTVEEALPIAATTRWSISWLNWKLLAGGIMLASVIVLGLAGPWFWNTHLARVASAPINLPPFWTTGGQLAHPLGTEDSGRDMLALIIVGAPASLQIGLIVGLIGIGVGSLLGFMAGYVGSWIDYAIRILSDSTLTIPSFAVLVVVAAFIHDMGVTDMALVISLFAWAAPTRVIRAQVLTLREQGYVRLARLSGLPARDIMFKEMLPNMLPFLAASFTGSVGAGIVASVGLEALGLGPQNTPTLGMTLADALQSAAIAQGLWWWWAVPTAILVFVFVGLFLATIGLDEIANPRLRGARA